MAQRQFRSDDTDTWVDRYGKGVDGSVDISVDSIISLSAALLTGTAGNNTATLDRASSFANGDLVAIFQMRGSGIGVWELNKISSGGGSTSITLAYNLCNSYSNTGNDRAQIVKIREYVDLTIDAGHQFLPLAWDGAVNGVFVAVGLGTAFVNGIINAIGRGFLGASGSGNSSGNSQTGSAGEGNTGPIVLAQNGANGSGGGGGGGSGDGGSGGGGGSHTTSGTSGANGQGVGGVGASTIMGNGELTIMAVGGGGGGGKGESNNNQGASGGQGQGGGGIIILIFKNIIINPSTGGIQSIGAQGSAANDGPSNQEGAGGGGGGAGGSVLLKGQNIDMGTSLIQAIGGIGGSSKGFASGNGGTGGDGRIHIDYSNKLTGSTSPVAATRQDLTLADQDLAQII